MIKDSDGFVTKEAIINSMCLSDDHRYFLQSQEDAKEYIESLNLTGDNAKIADIGLLTNMTNKEKEFLHQRMTSLYEGDIEPYMKIKKKFRK